MDTDRIAALKGKYGGNRCFIMGNGPSLNDTPLELLGGEHVWGVNKCHLLYERIAWRPSFFTSVDRRVAPSILPEIRRQVDKLPDTLFFLPEFLLEHGCWEPRDNLYFFHEIGQKPERGPDGYFSEVCHAYVRVPNTVIITCLQLAVYLGFNPIYLIGCDTRFVMPPGFSQGEGEVFDPGTGKTVGGYNLVMKAREDINHFDPRYFRPGDPWTAPNIEGQMHAYALVKEKCDALGVSVVNATVGGDLDVFPRIEFHNLFPPNPQQ